MLCCVVLSGRMRRGMEEEWPLWYHNTTRWNPSPPECPSTAGAAGLGLGVMGSEKAGLESAVANARWGQGCFLEKYVCGL